MEIAGARAFDQEGPFVFPGYLREMCVIRARNRFQIVGDGLPLGNKEKLEGVRNRAVGVSSYENGIHLAGRVRRPGHFAERHGARHSGDQDPGAPVYQERYST